MAKNQMCSNPCSIESNQSFVTVGENSCVEGSTEWEESDPSSSEGN